MFMKYFLCISIFLLLQFCILTANSISGSLLLSVCFIFLKKGRDVFNHSSVKLAPHGLDFLKIYCIGNFSLTLMRNQLSVI